MIALIAGAAVYEMVGGEPTTPLEPPANPNAGPDINHFFKEQDGRDIWIDKFGRLYESTGQGPLSLLTNALGGVIAADAYGACTWKYVNESMSEASRSYQEYITGVPSNLSCVVGTVKFDGFDYATQTYIEAKGPGYATENFYYADGSPKPWYEFSGHQAMIEQIRNQTTAAAGRPVIWYAATQHAADVMTRYIPDELKSQITVIYKAQP
jgi:Restriction endonuclease fold toxin 5